MDITQARFPNEFLKIVEHVADSHFIAFDLEFSGVAGRRRPPDRGKLTLQQVYEDVREAAMKYQVLQVGFTVVKEDPAQACYVALPYNININPLPSLSERRFGRQWSFHSGAIDFLLRNGFNLERPFTHGVQYLSEEEEDDTRSSWTRDDELRKHLVDMDTNTEDLPLIEHIHDSVSKWQALDKDHQDTYLNIPAEKPPVGVPEVLTRYQMRLTHQIVRNEYPRLKTVGMKEFIRVTNPTEEQQANEKAVQAAYRDREIAKAVGFRWLLDAIMGNDMWKLPDEYLMSVMSSSSRAQEGQTPIQAYLTDLQARLRARRKVLVGHNCFTDLVNLYATFIDDPPEKVQDFVNSLEDVERDLRTRLKPEIRVPADFDRYEQTEKSHEAGYDSLLTAKIAIKLSAKLRQENSFTKEEKDTDLRPFGKGEEADDYVTAKEFLTDTESGTSKITNTISNVLSTPANAVKNLLTASSAQSQSNPEERKEQKQSANANNSVNTHDKVLAVREKHNGRSRTREVRKLKNSFANSNIFDVLSHDASTGSSGSLDGLADKPAEDLMTFSSDEEISQESFVSDVVPADAESPGLIKVASKTKQGEIMPPWDDELCFWHIFGNKLQVNGSLERVCRLD